MAVPDHAERSEPVVRTGPVVVYGSANWDDIYQLPRYPGEHEKINADGLRQSLGGAGANTSTWLAGGEFTVEFVGAVGHDTEARLCLEALRRAGVGTAFIDHVEGAATGRACSWVVGDDKRIVRSRHPMLTRRHEQPDTLAMVARARHLHVASHVDGAGMDCVWAARGGGATVSVELSGNRLDEVREVAEVVFLNGVELEAIFGVTAEELTPAQSALIAPHHGALLVVTDGARAIYCASHTGVERFQVTPVAAVLDRTGAGDSFDAGFLRGWLNDRRDVAGAVASGQATSRRALGQLGASRRG